MQASCLAVPLLGALIVAMLCSKSFLTWYKHDVKKPRWAPPSWYGASGLSIAQHLPSKTARRSSRGQKWPECSLCTGCLSSCGQTTTLSWGLLPGVCGPMEAGRLTILLCQPLPCRQDIGQTFTGPGTCCLGDAKAITLLQLGSEEDLATVPQLDAVQALCQYPPQGNASLTLKH